MLFFNHLILHLELHLRASKCGGLPSSLSGSTPAIIWPAVDRDGGNSLGVCVVLVEVPPKKSHASYEASALPPSHHRWFRPMLTHTPKVDSVILE